MADRPVMIETMTYHIHTYNIDMELCDVIFEGTKYVDCMRKWWHKLTNKSYELNSV